MPELPEVETIRRSLEHKIKGKIFTGVDIYLEKILKGIDPGEFDEKLKGKKITGISRRGKYLIIQLAGGLVIVVHLRMTGQLLYCSAEQEKSKYTHMIFHLSDQGELRFVDQRQFGKVQFLPAKDLENHSSLKNLGVEPLSDEFTRGFFMKGLKNRRVKIKPLLLEQEFIAGIGNIYADEALFRAKVNPEKVASNLSSREASKLFIAIKEVLEEGIENKGTSIKDYIDGDGNQGNNQNNLRVYGREGQPCIKCGTEIQRVVIRGRSSHFCPKCQKN
ncbi:DNA-formamidopyrimidine glycosylase [Phosphitispora sp. TUW77]|uniref:DNA-formamidopyrimidine glycosylase n=1 Tax=Phosphitispora sp. TUW77 TaxID=3152361 RepID=UPI003AB668D6